MVMIPLLGIKEMQLITGSALTLSNPATSNPEYGSELVFSFRYSVEPTFYADVETTTDTLRGYSFNSIMGEFLESINVAGSAVPIVNAWFQPNYDTLGGFIFGTCEQPTDVATGVDLLASYRDILGGVADTTIENPRIVTDDDSTSMSVDILSGDVIRGHLYSSTSSDPNPNRRFYWVELYPTQSVQQAYEGPDFSQWRFSREAGSTVEVMWIDTEFDPPLPNKAVFTPTPIGAPWDYTHEVLEYENGYEGLGNILGDNFSIGDSFYTVFLYDWVTDEPIQPMLIRTAWDLSGFEVINVIGGDATTIDLIAQHMAGLIELSFAGSNQDGNIYFTAGPVGDPAFYATLEEITTVPIPGKVQLGLVINLGCWSPCSSLMYNMEENFR